MRISFDTLMLLSQMGDIQAQEIWDEVDPYSSVYWKEGYSQGFLWWEDADLSDLETKENSNA